jgi:hypothetical protein
MSKDIPAEILLAKSYDNLVELKNTVISFQEEASLIAEFTKLYIMNLFQLNRKDFKTILRKNRELHAKADKKELRGKDPVDALRVQMRQQNTFGKLLRRYSDHLGALDCILDVKATAALVHHLLKIPLSEKIPDRVTGCDFGAGTGILAVAGTIPFAKKHKFISVHIFEQSLESGKDAMKVMDIVLNESKYGKYLKFNLHRDDITTPIPYRIVTEAEKLEGPLALWISETFGFRTKKPEISKDLQSCTFADPEGTAPYSAELEKKYDPFPHVLNLSCSFFENFLQKIHTERIAAFPDIVTPRVIINGKKSEFLSPDGIWRKLHRIGRPYEMIPPCVPSRWYIKEQSRAALKKPFHKKIRKKRK